MKQNLMTWVEKNKNKLITWGAVWCAVAMCCASTTGNRTIFATIIGVLLVAPMWEDGEVNKDYLIGVCVLLGMVGAVFLHGFLVIGFLPLAMIPLAKFLRWLGKEWYRVMLVAVAYCTIIAVCL